MFNGKDFVKVLAPVILKENLTYKNIFKRETKIIAIAVIGLAVVLIGGSFALFKSSAYLEDNLIVLLSFIRRKVNLDLSTGIVENVQPRH